MIGVPLLVTPYFDPPSGDGSYARQSVGFLKVGAFLNEWVPCFTALRVRVSSECLHAYASDVVLGKSREHVFLSGFLELIRF